MNKLKKIFVSCEKKLLTPKYIVSEKWFIRSMFRYLRHAGVNLDGKPKFIARDVKFDLTDPSLITIGEGSVITSRVTVLTHDYSVECGLVAIGKEDPVYESVSLREVRIGKNCFVGQGSYLLPGTVLGDNCVVGAGSVVRGTIPAGTVLIGNPAVKVADTAAWAEKKAAQHTYKNGAKRR